MFVWQAHKGKIRSLAFSPDGTRLATATGKTRLVALWNPVTGELVRKLEPGGADRAVQSVAFAPDAPLFAAGMTNSIRVWSTADWTVVAVLAGRERGTGAFYELTFGRGPAPRIAGGESRRVHVWENAGAPGAFGLSSRRRPDVAFMIENVPCLDFSPDGARLATNVLFGAQFWEPTTGKLLRTIPHTHSKHHGPVRFSPDGTRVAVGYRNVVTVYPTAEGAAETVTCKGHTNAIWSACWSADGRTLLTASADGTARLWDPTSGAEQRTFEWGIGKIHAVAFSADGLLGAAGGADGKLVVWDVDA